jgi:hypothetical protein
MRENSTSSSARLQFSQSLETLFIEQLLTRLLLAGPAMQLAEISNPREQALYEGSAILNNVGFSPLTLAALGLLSRLLDSINKTHHTFVQPRMLKLIELLVLVGLILGIVGGIDAADAYVTSGRYQPGSLNKAGTALMIVAWVLLAIATALASFSISHAEHGERRLLMAIVLALPFLLVSVWSLHYYTMLTEINRSDSSTRSSALSLTRNRSIFLMEASQSYSALL